MNNPPSIGQRNVLLTLLAIFFFHLIISGWVMSQSDIVCIYDESARLGGAYMFAGDPHGFLSKVSYFSLLDSGQGHPHFVEWVAGLAWTAQKFFGNVEFWRVILLTNAVFGLILIFSTYGLGSMIYGRQAGLLAAFMIAMLPVVFSQSRALMLDYPLMGMVTLSFWLLYQTRGFSSLTFCLLFGIAAAFSQLTKGSAVIFIGVPWLYYFMNAFVLGPRDVVARGGFVSLLVYAVIAGSVYFSPQNLHVFSLYKVKAGMFSAGVSPMYYLREIDKLIGCGVFWISIPFLLNYLIRLKNRDLFLFFWLFILLALLNASPNKTPRFLLPLMPAFALIVSGEAISYFRTKFVGAASCAVLIAALSVQFYSSNISFDRSVYSDPSSEGRSSRQRDGLSSTRRQLIDIFHREYSRTGLERRSIVLPLFNAPHILDFLRIEFMSRKMPFMLEQPLQYDRSGFLQNQWRGGGERVLQADYLLVDVGNMPGSVPGNYLGKGLRDGFTRYKDHFERIAEVQLSDSARIDIYRRRRSVARSEPGVS